MNISLSNSILCRRTCPFLFFLSVVYNLTVVHRERDKPGRVGENNGLAAHVSVLRVIVCTLLDDCK